MATLIPKHEKLDAFRIPSYLFSQILDVFEDVGISNHNLDNTSTSAPTFVDSETAIEFSDTLRDLLDEEKLSIAKFPSNWWVTGEAKSIALNTATADDVTQRINGVGRRHFYFRTEVVVRASDVDFTPLTPAIERRLADLSAFMKMSRGFWLNWG